MDNSSFKFENDLWSNLGSGDGTISYVNSEDPSKFIYADPQVNEFEYSAAWSGIDNADDLNCGDTYLGMPFEGSMGSPNMFYNGISKHNSMSCSSPTQFAKIVSYDADNIADGPTIFNFPAGASAEDLGTSNVTSIAVAESNTDKVYVSLNAEYGWNLWVSGDAGNTFSPVIGTSSVDYDNESGSSPNYPMTGPLHNKISDIAISSTDETLVWISFDGVSRYDNEYIEEKWRVLKTDSPGSGIWYDYSDGLPNLPVNTILYVDGYKDLLFAGTDAGVYYRTNDMAQWECFNNGLPLCLITDLEFDYCTKELYASTFGRSVWKVKIPFNLAGEPGTDDEIVITSDETWTTSQDIRQSIRILPGQHLRIETPSGASETTTINMLTDKKIYVEQGARLTIDGATITNDCAGFWGGIEVWGD